MAKEAKSCILGPGTILPIELSGPGVSPLESAVSVLNLVFQTLCFDIPVCQMLATLASLMAGPVSSSVWRASFKQFGIVNATALTNGKTLIHQSCQRNFPALAHITKTLAVGHATSVKNTSLKFDSPDICLIGRTSIPGDFMSRKKNVSPLCSARSDPSA
ncbi:MAG: hypothetical protein CM15mP21_1510 [Hyphomicrobiales bacterium]|nr:MAG: hypothetical protein CM15mP21_1510 [Hyphomicrobiales bacterium]